MPITRAKSKMAVASSQIGRPALSLLTLAMEVRFQIYECLLLPEVFNCDEKPESVEPDDPLNNNRLSHQSDSFDVLTGNSLQNHFEQPQQPTYQNRKVYGELLLVCKMIHAEAAPLFYRKATFFIK